MPDSSDAADSNEAAAFSSWPDAAFPVYGFVLAGGQSSRMGRDKALLEIGGSPLLRRVLDSLVPFCARLFVVAREGAPYGSFGYPLLADLRPGLGPLSGIHAALRKAEELAVLRGGPPGAARCLLAACDQPFLAPALLEALVAGSGDRPPFRACVPGGRLRGLPALVPALWAGECEERLTRGELRLGAFLDACAPAVLSEADCRRLDPELRSFRNLNTPSDAAAHRL